MRLWMPFLVIMLIAAPAFAQRAPSSRGKSLTDKNGVTADDLVQKEGVIALVTRHGNGKVEIAVKQEGADKNEIFTLDWRCMVYRLTDRNVQIFKEQDKLADIAKDINKLRSRQDELPEKEMQYQLSTWEHLYVYPNGNVHYYSGYSPYAAESLNKAQQAWKREEEERRNHYGKRVRLVSGLPVVVIAAKSSDTTYGVFVTKVDESKEEKPEKSEKTLLPNASPTETEANSKLKFAENMLDEAKKAKGSDKDRLLDSARERLKDIIKKYPDTDAAKQAKDLLDKS
jgi:hypothetical protein